MDTPAIIISYARDDAQAAADQVVALLREAHLPYALDHECLEGGTGWKEQFRRLIKGGQHLVLMLSSAALASKHCHWEWECAREAGLQVSPVRVGRALDTSGLPAWMRAAHHYNLDFEGQRQRFLRVLEGPPHLWRVPFMVEGRSSAFVDRPGPLSEAKEKLLSGASVGITAALRGLGGFGKTSLAAQLAADRAVRDEFYDGVLWVTFGQQPGDPVPKLANLVEAIEGKRPGFTELTPAREAFSKALGDRRCLLVLDDVCRRADVEPFLASRPDDRTARLITTQNRATLPPGTAHVVVDEMTQAEAIALLSRGLEVEPAAAPALRRLAVERFGGWALLLELGNSLLRGRVEKRQTLAEALAHLDEGLARRGVQGALARGTAENYDRGVEGAVALTLETLSAEMRAQAEALGAVMEDARVTLASAARLWGVDEHDAEDIADTLHDRSLITDLDLGVRHFTLHDTLRQVLGERAGPEGLHRLHGQIAAAWRAEVGGHWEQLRDSYALEHLPAHLRAAGDLAGLEALLLDPGWMIAKLRGPGVQALLADYRRHAPDRGSAAGKVGQVLALAAGALADDPEELPGQLLGRLAVEYGAGIATLRDRARRLARPGNLLPAWPSLTGPGAELMRLLGHKSRVASVCFSPDGARLASGSWDNTLRLWDAASGALLATLEGHTSAVTSVCFSPDGARLASGSNDNTLRLWDAASGALLATLEGHTSGVTSVCFSPDGARLASGSWDNTLRLWDAASGAPLATLERHTSWVTSVCFSPDGARLASGSFWDETLRLWDAASGALLATLEGYTNTVMSVSFSPDGARLALGSGDNAIRLFDAASGALLVRRRGHKGGVTSVCFSPDGARLASGSNDNTLRLWDAASGAPLATLEGHTDDVTSVCFSPDGARLASGGDNTLRLWDAASGAPPATLEGHTSKVTSVCFSPDGARLASGSYDSTVRLWDAASGAQVATLGLYGGIVASVCFSPDGARLASGSWDNTLRLWDAASSALLATLEGHTKSVTSVCFSPDGARLASGSWDNTLRLWDAASGALLATLEGHTSKVTSVCFSPDGARLASGSYDSTLRLWDAASGARLATLEADASLVNSVCFSPDGARLASGSHDNTLRLWDAASGALLATLEGHTDHVTSVCFSPDGALLVSGCDDRILRLWDAASGAQLAWITLDAAVNAVAFARDGRLAAGDTLGRLHLFTIKGHAP